MHLLQAKVRWKRLSGSHPGGRSPLSAVTTKVYVREILTVSCREMLDDDLDADGDEDEAADDLDFALERMAEALASSHCFLVRRATSHMAKRTTGTAAIRIM